MTTSLIPLPFHGRKISDFAIGILPAVVLENARNGSSLLYDYMGDLDGICSLQYFYSVPILVATFGSAIITRHRIIPYRLFVLFV